jgi:hypothetical protein
MFELYDQLKNGKLACWDVIVSTMNNEFPERFPKFTNEGLRSRHKRINKKKRAEDERLPEIPPNTHILASTDY